MARAEFQSHWVSSVRYVPLGGGRGGGFSQVPAPPWHNVLEASYLLGIASRYISLCFSFQPSRPFCMQDISRYLPIQTGGNHFTNHSLFAGKFPISREPILPSRHSAMKHTAFQRVSQNCGAGRPSFCETPMFQTWATIGSQPWSALTSWRAF